MTLERVTVPPGLASEPDLCGSETFDDHHALPRLSSRETFPRRPTTIEKESPTPHTPPRSIPILITVVVVASLLF
jgi:hypothetical protein